MIGTVLRRRAYATLFALLFVKGAVLGASAPFLALWLVRDLGATPVTAGLLRTCIGVTALAYGLVAARVTDRTLVRRPWILGALAVETMGWILLPRAPSVATGLAVATLAGFAGTGMLFASLADWVVRDDRSSGTIYNVIRAGFTMGWMAGPAVGGIVVRTYGTRGLFTFVACLQVALVVIAAVSLADAPRRARPAAAERKVTRAALVVHVMALALAFGADGATRSTLLPLYVVDTLHVSIATFGLVLTCGVAVELPTMLVTGRLADRFGTTRVVRIGLGALVCTFVVLAASTSLLGVIAAEVIRTVYVSSLTGISILRLQRLLPGRAGAAAAVYGAAFQLGPAAAAPMLGAETARAGWSVTFVSCAAMAILALLLDVVAEGPRNSSRADAR